MSMGVFINVFSHRETLLGLLVNKVDTPRNIAKFVGELVLALKDCKGDESDLTILPAIFKRFPEARLISAPEAFPSIDESEAEYLAELEQHGFPSADYANILIGVTPGVVSNMIGWAVDFTEVPYHSTTLVLEDILTWQRMETYEGDEDELDPIPDVMHRAFTLDEMDEYFKAVDEIPEAIYADVNYFTEWY